MTLTTAQILAQSSNVGAIKIGAAAARARRASTQWVRRFGFGKPTGVDLPGEEPGHRAHAARTTRAPRWATCRSARASSVTPMQMATAYAAIANGGILRAPHVVAAIGGEPAAEPAGHRVISSRTSPTSCARCSRACSRPGGTASEVSIPGYELAGKTGTANKIDKATGDYSKTRLRRLVRRLRARRQPEAADAP